MKILKHLLILFFVYSFNIGFGQTNILNKINTYNEKGDYQKSLKQIKKYIDEKHDTLNCYYLICLADYYCIPNSNEYNPVKSNSIIDNINCEKLNAEPLGISFKNKQECLHLIKAKKDKYKGVAEKQD